MLQKALNDHHRRQRELDRKGQRLFSRLGSSKHFGRALAAFFVVECILFLAFGTAKSYSSFGSVVVVVGVAAVFIFEAERSRFERQRELAFNYKTLSLLNTAMIAVMDLKERANTPDAKKEWERLKILQESDEPLEAILESRTPPNNQDDYLFRMQEKRVLRIRTLEAILIMGGTLQWGYGGDLFMCLQDLVSNLVM